jgi:GNAT superfamily N-acetyltransferase
VNEYRIVKATKGRMAEVAEVFRKSFRATYPNFLELHSAAEDRVFFTGVVFEKNSVYLAQTVEDDRAVGFIAFNCDFIDHLYVAPEAQKNRIGSELIAIAKRESDKLRLWTFQQNTGARAFYKKQGFLEILETDGFETQEKQPDVLLEWTR